MFSATATAGSSFYSQKSHAMSDVSSVHEASSDQDQGKNT